MARPAGSRHGLALHARHAVPNCWIVDPAARTIEAYVLEGRAYRIDVTWDGREPVALAPFPELSLDSRSLWR
jgi:hypothetical protein